MSLSNIMSNFFGAPTAPAAPATVVPPTDTAFQQSTQTDPVPASSQNPSPMAEFADLFNTVPKAADAPPSLLDPIFNLDTVAMQGIADKMSFSQHPQFADLAGKATRGDVEALAQLLDFSARSAYMKSTELNTTMAENAAKTMAQRLQSILPKEVVDIQSRQELNGHNANYSDPAYAPVIQAIRSQVMQKNPNATPTQIAEMTQRYVSNFAAATTPQSTAPVAPATPARSPFSYNDFFK